MLLSTGTIWATNILEQQQKAPQTHTTPQHCILHSSQVQLFSCCCSGCPSSAVSLRGFHWGHEHTHAKWSLTKSENYIHGSKPGVSVLTKLWTKHCVHRLFLNTLKSQWSYTHQQEALVMGTAVRPQSDPALGSNSLGEELLMPLGIPSLSSPILLSAGRKVTGWYERPSSQKD